MRSARAGGALAAGVLAVGCAASASHPPVENAPAYVVRPPAYEPPAASAASFANVAAAAAANVDGSANASANANTAANANANTAANANANRAALALGSPWGYVLPVDHGMRWDLGGKGYFGAARADGDHSGVDFLAPRGTPVLAPCAGEGRAGEKDGFGRFVQLVCPVPSALAPGLYLSLLFAHLDAEHVGPLPVAIAAGRRIGEVGKTGAEGPYIAPHLHLEMVVRASAAEALAETHEVADRSDDPAAERFAAALEERCIAPSAFSSKKGKLRCERRVDPFMVLSCLTLDKPRPSAARWPVGSASMPWSEVYSATGFDVDAGRDVPAPVPKPPAPYAPPLAAVVLEPGG